MTVWVLHPVDKDLSEATQWGSISYVGDDHVYADELDPLARLPQAFLERLRGVARDWNRASDYFLLVGDQLQLVYLAAELSKGGSFWVLRYDRKVQGYVPVWIG